MAEITKQTTVEHQKRYEIFGYAIVLLGVFLYFWGLDLYFFGPDEPRYAQVAREMFERGDWVTPTLGGAHWFEKPALLYWSMIASFNVFGVSEFAARLGPAIFGLLTIGCIALVVRRATDPSEIETSFSPFIYAAMIAASTLGLIVFSRGASFDITVTFPLTVCFTAFYMFDSRPDGRRANLWLAAMYIFAGVAVLAKGLIGIVFPAAIIGLYMLLRREKPSRELLLSVLWGTPLLLMTVSTWYLPMYLRHGWDFIDEFFIQHHFQRYTSNKYLHPQPFHFFFWVLPMMTLPWLPAFFIAFYRAIKSTWASLAISPAEHCMSRRATILCICWLLVPLGFFSLSGSKLPGYILPAVPPAIILTAMYLQNAARRRPWVARLIPAVSISTFVICIVMLKTVVPSFNDADSAGGLMRSADERGYTTQKVYGLHMISHSAEYYAAGRLLREPDGRQKKLYNPAEVVTEMVRDGVTDALVLVPNEYASQLTSFQGLRTEVIRDNGEKTIAYVSR